MAFSKQTAFSQSNGTYNYLNFKAHLFGSNCSIKRHKTVHKKVFKLTSKSKENYYIKYNKHCPRHSGILFVMVYGLLQMFLFNSIQKAILFIWHQCNNFSVLNEFIQRKHLKSFSGEIIFDHSPKINKTEQINIAISEIKAIPEVRKRDKQDR